MEMTLAILMVLGIYVGIPTVIGFAIAGVYTAVKAEKQVEAPGEAQLQTA